MAIQRTSPRRRQIIRCGVAGAIAVALAAGVVGLTTSAQPRQGQSLADAADAFPNFDIRLDKAKATPAQAEFLQRFAIAPPGTSALADLAQSAVSRLTDAGAAVDDNPALGAVEIVSAQPGLGFLTAASDDRVAAFREFLDAHAQAYGLTDSQVRSLEVVADYMNPAGNMGWVEFEQKFGGIPVFQGLLRGGFTAKGELARTTGVLAAGVDESALATTPSVGAAQAVALAAANVGWAVAESSLVERPSASANHVTFDRGTMAGEPSAWLVYFPLARGVARLAWATQIIGDPYGFLSVVDAETGTLLFRKNLTNFQTQSATYNIYNDDSPAPSSPTTALPGANFQAPFIARQSVTLIGNEAPNTFNNLGWMTDNTNGANGQTDGNNVEAGLDLTLPDGVDAPVPGVARAFNFAYNPQTDDPATANYRNGEVTDMFFWTNVYHDRLYRLGFTEAARNFQNDNFGRGGLAADRVRAEGQDNTCARPPCVNNANFTTPVDGSRGRMQMYIFNGPTPDRTSAIDHDVLLHELTHGTSNRLHNNGSGLGTTMSGGMGEGWSDFYARALLAHAAEDPNGVFTTGGWVTHLITTGYTDNYYYGIRRFPYAVRSNVGSNGRPHNPLTFADIDPAQINLTDGAHPRGPIGSASAFQVHNIGEVWASALNEVRARFIGRLGFDVGNQRLLQFVTDGMKLDPVNPTLLQGRDAIIAAANAGGGTAADINDIWAGFAVRGMGFSAQVVNANTGTVVEAFDTPGIAAGTATLVSESIPNGRLDPNETVGVSFCLTKNSGTQVSGAVTGTLQSTGGVVSPSGPQSFGTVPVSATVCRTFTFVVSATCGANVTATILADESGATTRTLNYTLPVGTFASFFTENFDGVVAPALPAGWSTSTLWGWANLWVTNTTTPDSTPNRAFAADPDGVTDNVLLSPSIGMPGGLSRLSFRHSFNVETNFDGGVLEISIGGGAFQDVLVAGGSFVSNGYNGTISTIFSSITGRQVWTGNSSGYVTTTVNLPASASGQNIRLRWRMATDTSVSGVGWAVDTVALTSPSCTTGPPQAEPPTGLVAASVVGNVVTLQWQRPAFGLTPTGHVLEGGINPGEVLASIPTGSTAPTYTFVAPTGSFYVRMHTQAGASRSVASNEIRIHVNVPVAPSAPANLLGLAAGNTIALAWKNTFVGGSPSTLLLDVSGSLSTTLALGLTDSFQFAGVPNGTYTLSLRAANGAGSSPSSNSLTLTFPGACGPPGSSAPQAATNFVTYKVGNTIYVTWDPPAAGPAPTSYLLNVTGSFVGSIPTAGRALSGAAGPGSYNLSVVAVNPCGNGPATPAQTVTLP